MSRFKRKLSTEYPIHVGARVNNREPFPIPISDAWEVLSDYLFLIHGEFNIKIHSFVLMSNHFHMICHDPLLKLPIAMELFMKETSREMARMSGRINRIWGKPYHSSILSSPLYYLHTYKYIYRNPVAAGVCSQVEAYSWSSMQILLGLKKGIIPIEPDNTLFPDLENSLKWLNHAYSEQEATDLKNALRKKTFGLRKDSNKRLNALEDWKSTHLPRGTTDC